MSDFNINDYTRETINAANLHMAAQVPGSAYWFLRSTPIMKVPGKAMGVDCREVWLKLEHLQVSGSFKVHGMLNLMCTQTVPAAGVVIASGGNAGIACAAAAQVLGHTCEVFLPSVSSQAKRDALAHWGAKVTIAGEVYADALAASQERSGQTGALLAHAYDLPEVVLGAGTLAKRIEDQAGVPDDVLVSVGGGGLIGGVAAWFAEHSTVTGVEPERAPTLHAARAAGKPVDVAVSGIAADALGATRIGNIGWGIAQRWVENSVLVTDEAIAHAQKTLWLNWRLAVEPAAAAGLAALQSGAFKVRSDHNVCLILCGGNASLAQIAGASATTGT